MKTIIAIKFSKGFTRNFDIIKTVIKYRGIEELVLFGNGIELPYLTKDGLGCELTIMENDTELKPDKVYRQIISYVHHNYSDGVLFIFDGSDKLPESDEFLNDTKQGILIKSNCGGEFSANSQLRNLLQLRYPLGFDVVLDIAKLKYALQSRDYVSFVEYFTRGIWKDSQIEAFIPEVASFSDEHLIEILDEKYFNKIESKIINYLTSRNK